MCFWRKSMFSGYDGKIFFSPENTFLQFWREYFLRFWPKVYFCDFGEKIRFCDFCGKVFFWFLCDFTVLAGSVLLLFWWKSTFLRFWQKKFIFRVLAEKCVLWKFVFLRFLLWSAFLRFWWKNVFCGFDEKMYFRFLTEKCIWKELGFWYWKNYFDFKVIFVICHFEIN